MFYMQMITKGNRKSSYYRNVNCSKRKNLLTMLKKTLSLTFMLEEITTINSQESVPSEKRIIPRKSHLLLLL